MLALAVILVPLRAAAANSSEDRYFYFIGVLHLVAVTLKVKRNVGGWLGFYSFSKHFGGTYGVLWNLLSIGDTVVNKSAMVPVSMEFRNF